VSPAARVFAAGLALALALGVRAPAQSGRPGQLIPDRPPEEHAPMTAEPSPDAGPAPADVPAELLTVAEASGFTRTAGHADVVALLDRLAARAPWATRASLGQSHEGGELPLLVLADPPVADAAAARASGKAVVLVFADIHAGEVCGKEALPMLARELLLEPEGDDGRTWLLTRRVVAPPFVLRPERYDDFREVCARIDEAERSRLRFRVVE